MNEYSHTNDDLSDMLTELRILLPGAQLLTAFLIMLPFNSGFKQIVQSEKWVFMATFICSIVSLVLFTAPAVQHRLMRPLPNRHTFKLLATRQMLAGSVALSFALILGTDFVLSEVFGHVVGGLVSALFALLVAGLWWYLPHVLERKTFS